MLKGIVGEMLEKVAWLSLFVITKSSFSSFQLENERPKLNLFSSSFMSDLFLPM